MKSSTYSILVLLVFIHNIEKGECESIKQLIQVADKLASKLSINVDISYMTKYNVIRDLLKQGILIKGSKSGTQPILPSDDIIKYIVTSMDGIVAI